MFCTNCGTQFPDGNRFCSNCGAPQAAPAQPMYQQPADLEKRYKNYETAPANTFSYAVVDVFENGHIQGKVYLVCEVEATLAEASTHPNAGAPETKSYPRQDGTTTFWIASNGSFNGIDMFSGYTDGYRW